MAGPGSALLRAVYLHGHRRNRHRQHRHRHPVGGGGQRRPPGGRRRGGPDHLPGSGLRFQSARRCLCRPGQRRRPDLRRHPRRRLGPAHLAQPGRRQRRVQWHPVRRRRPDPDGDGDRQRRPGADRLRQLRPVGGQPGGAAGQRGGRGHLHHRLPDRHHRRPGPLLLSARRDRLLLHRRHRPGRGAGRSRGHPGESGPGRHRRRGQPGVQHRPAAPDPGPRRRPGQRHRHRPGCGEPRRRRHPRFRPRRDGVFRRLPGGRLLLRHPADPRPGPGQRRRRPEPLSGDPARGQQRCRGPRDLLPVGRRRHPLLLHPARRHLHRPGGRRIFGRGHPGQRRGPAGVADVQQRHPDLHRHPRQRRCRPASPAGHGQRRRGDHGLYRLRADGRQRQRCADGGRRPVRRLRGWPVGLFRRNPAGQRPRPGPRRYPDHHRRR